MRTPLPIALAVPAIMCGLATRAVAADHYTYFTDQHYHGATGDKSYGLATGVLVCEQKLPSPPIRLRPIALFGAVKSTDGRSQFLYLLIVKTPAGFTAESLDVSWGGHGSSQTGAEGTMAVKVGAKKVEVSYRFATDAAAHAVGKSSLIFGSRKVKEGDPRVFVVDLTGEEVIYTPVKVELPKEAPDVSQSKTDAWGPAVQRAVDQLRKDSLELNKLLDARR